MATCKNCLHNNACVDMLQALGFTVDGDGYLADKRCRIFKDKNEYSRVVHAKWERKPGTKHEWWCPACKRVFPYSYTSHNYCPNCGAKMDGGNGDGDTR